MSSPEAALSLLPAATRRWLRHVLGDDSQIVAVQPLAGATSAMLHSLTVQQREPGQPPQQLVLRRFTQADWLAEEPDLAAHEAAALAHMAAASLPTPLLVAVDETGAGCDVPAILMTRLPGRVVLQPADMAAWLQELAAALVVIHAQPADFAWQFFPYNPAPVVPAWSADPALWRAGLAQLSFAPPPAPLCFIHRDYHPTNVLWQGGQVSGVVDWVNACRGPAGVDVGHCRINLAQIHGLAAADQFLIAYQRLAGQQFIYHPYWDLRCLFDFNPEQLTVYDGWPANGLHHLTPPLLGQRLEAYLASLLRRMAGAKG